MNQRLVFSLIAIVLGFEVLAQTPDQSANGARLLPANKPPSPIWSGEGKIPAGSGKQRVFLTPDLHSVILLWQNSDGAERKRKFPLHNEIDPILRVRMEDNSGLYRYRYDLENGKDSKDSLADFSVVIYPDPGTELSSAQWSKGSIVPADSRPKYLSAPYGALAGWDYKLDNPLFLKAGMSTNFTIITSARPGFTRAETEHYPHDEPSDGWPEDLPQETIDQLMPVIGEYGWSSAYLITLGPRFGPDDPDAGIASDYLLGIQELIRIHWLEQDSPFVKEAIANLDAIASGSSAQFKFTQKPNSEFEAEILSGLELALHIAYAGPK